MKFESDFNYDILLKYQKVKISSLKSSNDYIIWESSMKIMLMHEDTLKLIQNKLEKLKKNDKIHHKWEVLNDHTIIIIRINYDKELQHHIHHFINVRKIWLYIKKHYKKFILAKEIEFFMKLTRIWLDKHLNMRSYFIIVYDHIEKVNQWISKQFFQNWMTCLLLVKEFSFKYNIWTS